MCRVPAPSCHAGGRASTARAGGRAGSGCWKPAGLAGRCEVPGVPCSGEPLGTGRSRSPGCQLHLVALGDEPPVGRDTFCVPPILRSSDLTRSPSALPRASSGSAWGSSRIFRSRDVCRAGKQWEKMWWFFFFSRNKSFRAARGRWALGRAAGTPGPSAQGSGLLRGATAWPRSRPGRWGGEEEAGLEKAKDFVVERVNRLTRMLRQRRREVWLPPQGPAAAQHPPPGTQRGPGAGAKPLVPSGTLGPAPRAPALPPRCRGSDVLWAVGSVPGGRQGWQRVGLGETLGEAGKAMPLWGGCWWSVLGLEAGGEAGWVGAGRIGERWSSAPALHPALYLFWELPRGSWPRAPGWGVRPLCQG